MASMSRLFLWGLFNGIYEAFPGYSYGPIGIYEAFLGYSYGLILVMAY